MNTRRPSLASRGVEGTSILVVIGVLAVIAIFAVGALRAIIREIDHTESRNESATLKSQKQAIEQAILRYGSIPDPTNWVQNVATELGQSTNAVALNARHQPRLLMVDTGGWLTNLSLPYSQTSTGLATQPINARMMIVSSLGTTLPALGSYPSATEFAALWNCRDGAVPTTSAWTGWSGRPSDIKVERILLDPLFVALRLTTGAKETNPGQYAIGTSTPLFSAPLQQLSNPPRYLLRGTELWLYADAASGSLMDSHQILSKDAFYRYENGIWKSSAVGADLPGGLDLATVVKGFLDATPNTNALNGAAQQRMVVQSMMDFIKGYNAWAVSGFPDDATKTALQQTQVQMMLRCQELFKESGGSANYFPINNGPCE